MQLDRDDEKLFTSTFFANNNMYYPNIYTILFLINNNYNYVIHYTFN